MPPSPSLRPLLPLYVVIFFGFAVGRQADQGRVMGNNQALQVGAESLSGILGGLLAAVMVKLSLIVLGVIAIVAAGVLLVVRRRGAVTPAAQATP